MARFLAFLVEEVEEEIIGRTLDDVYALLEDIASDISRIKTRISSLETAVGGFQDVFVEKMELLHTTVSDKLDGLTAVVKEMPQYVQIEYVIAFLFMLVCFEFIRMVRNWTNGWKRGGR